MTEVLNDRPERPGPLRRLLIVLLFVQAGAVASPAIFLGRLEPRLAALEARADKVDARLTAIEGRLGEIDRRLTTIETTLGRILDRLPPKP